MDKKEYNRKRDLIASSEASPDVKAEAMFLLEEQYIGIKMKALALIRECASDPATGD